MQKTISELIVGYTDGSYTPTDAVKDYFAVIASKDADIHAFLHTYKEEAVQAAELATAAYAAGATEGKPLLGIPLAIKNNILIKDTK